MYREDWGTSKQVWKAKAEPGKNYTVRKKVTIPGKAWARVKRVKVNGKEIGLLDSTNQKQLYYGRGAAVKVTDRPGPGPLRFAAASLGKKPVRVKVVYKRDVRDPWLRHPDPSAPKNQPTAAALRRRMSK